MELIVLWLGIAVVTAIAASARGRSAVGWFVLGLLFSLLALLAVLVMRPGEAAAAADAPYDPVTAKGPPRTGTVGGVSRGKLHVRGDGQFLQDVVGESQFRDAIRDAVGDPGADGVDLRKMATVEPQDRNPHDGNAMAIRLGGKLVGFLPRDDAAVWRKAMEKAGVSGASFQAAVRVRHGWERGPDDTGDFSIMLDASYPIEFYRD